MRCSITKDHWQCTYKTTMHMYACVWVCICVVYMYVGVCIYVCIFMWICMCICMHIYVYVCICTYMHEHVCAYTCVHTQVFVCICMSIVYMYMYVCVRVCMYMQPSLEYRLITWSTPNVLLYWTEKPLKLRILPDLYNQPQILQLLPALNLTAVVKQFAFIKSFPSIRLNFHRNDNSITFILNSISAEIFT